MNLLEAKRIANKNGYRVIEAISQRKIERIQDKFPQYNNKHINYIEKDVEEGAISTTDAFYILQAWYNKDESSALGMVDHWSQKYDLPRAKITESKLKEGTWSFQPDFYDEAKRKLEALKKWLYGKFGDDTLFDGLDASIRRLDEMLDSYKENPDEWKIG